MVEEALGVSKWTAWRILKRCGAEDGPGGSLVCRREELIGRLRGIQEGSVAAPEIERRKRVERYLDEMKRFLTQKGAEVARNEVANVILSSRFANLPPGVALEPGELRIHFSGMADFLQKFGAVVFALQNDFERVSELLERSPRNG